MLSLQTENYSLKLNTLFYELIKQWIQPFPTIRIWHRYSSWEGAWYHNFSYPFCVYRCRIYHYRHSKNLQRSADTKLQNGPYAVRIDTVGNSSDLYNQLNRITGYRPALAKKVIDNVPTLAAKGLSRQDAEDFVTIFEATGATASVVAM